ncbi:SusD/RagB family nutrient-binding outer membrane lipoprotein [Bacteroides salyersiae]|jgi:hypothetical protein|uniref:SusD/RagB family nutrient-binding outer membrane lipoprotein n=1 Tax=Bacteroides salyersiae TaxID=291644 RepID=UPI001C8B7A9E|nr:SusD/RagB family nutrient-binding outer membrane lipoprotein [Bacteroides salyersiae]
MKFNNKLLIGTILSLSVGLSSCYDTALEYDGNANSIKSDDGTGSDEGFLASPDIAVGFLRTAQFRVIDSREHKYQYQCSFIGDDPVGYMSSPHSFDGRLTSSLAFYSDFVSGPEANLQWVAQQAVPVMRSADTLQIAPLGAFASILLSDVALQYTNTHGPMPLSDYKELKENRPLTYEKQSVVYTKLFQDLIKADSILAEYEKEPVESVNELIESTDMLTEQSTAANIISMWRKYANSLILRMAMTAVDVQGYTCNINGEEKTVQQLGEEAVRRGVLQAGDKTIGLLCGTGTDVGYHPLYKIAIDWVDSRLNASYHNYLVRTQHPILEFWFAKNQGAITNDNQATLKKETKFLSIRSGMDLETAALTTQTYQYYSKFNLNFAGEKLAFFKVEEVLFLLAEASLRGWNVGGTAENFYNAGIKEFFTKHSFSDAAYQEYMAWKGMGNIGVSPQIKEEAIYRDFMESDNDLPLWGGYYMLNNSYDKPANADTNPYINDSKEQKLQKIITQKWIALFPQSSVSWADYRRTGYPKLLPYCPFAYGNSDGSLEEPRYNWITGDIVSEGVTIRRIRYNTANLEVANEVVLTAEPALNEETTGVARGDVQGTRLWWDIADKKTLD